MTWLQPQFTIQILLFCQNSSFLTFPYFNIFFFCRFLFITDATRTVLKEQVININLSVVNRFIIKYSSEMSYNHFFDVPLHFVPIPNTVYKIVSVKDTNKAFTVTKGHHGQKVYVSDYIGDAAQKFTFGFQGNKLAFVAQATNTALYIPHHNKNNGAEIEADGKQHKSNWFEIVPVQQGEAAGKGYAIKAISEKVLDLEEGKTQNGTRVLQWDYHGGANQVWLIVPADQPIAFNNHNHNQWGNQLSSQGFGQHHGHKGHKDHNHGHGHGHGHSDKTNSSNQGFSNQGSNQGFINQGFNQPVEMEGIFKKNYTYAILCSANQAKCLQVTQDGHVVVADFNGNVAQKYTFEYDTFFKHYLIKTVANGQYFSSPGVFGGDDIKTKEKGIHCEKWTIEPSKKMGFGFTIRSFNGNAIDIPANNYNNGTHAQKHGFHGDSNQTFVIMEK